MRKFTTKIGLLVIPIFLMIIIMEVGLRNMPSDYKLKKEYLDSNSNEIETLILGSSHAFFGIDPKYFSSKTFNASYVSQSIDYDILILNKYINEFNNLETIVLPISYFSLFSNLRIGPESWRIKNYSIYSDVSFFKHPFHSFELFNYKLKESTRKSYDYYVKGNTPLHSSDLGWGTSYNSKYSLDLLETGEASAVRHRCDLDLEMIQEAYKENLVLLNSFLKWCEQENIHVILLTLPAYESYIKNLDNDQLSLTIETANDLASKFNNCKYYNLIDDPKFTANDFYDGDHLSEIGAKKLSSIISSMIEASYESF